MNTQTTLALEPKTIENADPISKPLLEGSLKSLGMVPNMYAGMANNPALFDGYLHAYKSFRANAGFTPPEQEVIYLSVAVENECDYCVAAHSFIGDNMTQVPKEVTDAIRNGERVPDEKYRALSQFTQAVVAKRGRPSEEEIENFLQAGYTQNHILGVIAGVAVKTFSNYFNHIFETPLDEAFQARAWSK